MKSFVQKLACIFTGNLHKNRTKLPENSRAIFLRNDFTIVRLSHLRNPANRRAASDEKPTPDLQTCETRKYKNSENKVYYRGSQSKQSLPAGGLGGAVSPPSKFDISNKVKVNLRHLMRVITDILKLTLSCIFSRFLCLT